MMVTDRRGVRDLLDLGEVLLGERRVGPGVRPHHAGLVVAAEQQPVVVVILAEAEVVHDLVGEAGLRVVDIPVRLIGRPGSIHCGVVNLDRHAAAAVAPPVAVDRP